MSEGFVPPVDRSGRLKFEHPDYKGAEVLVSLDIDLGTFLKFTTETGGAEENVLGLLADRCKWFGERLLMEWNITDRDGKAIPATGEGMLEIPQSFAALIFSTWATTVSGRTAPLAEPSPNGSTPAQRKKAGSRRSSRKRS